jgi:hypothetical protein
MDINPERNVILCRCCFLQVGGDIMIAYTIIDMINGSILKGAIIDRK